MIKGAVDRWLDRRLGGFISPNLPSRLIECTQCKKIWHVNQLEKTCRHHLKIVDETLWNYLKSLRS